VEDTIVAAPHSSPPRTARGRRQQGDKPPSPIQKIFSLLFGTCKSQHTTEMKAQHERRARRKYTKSVKEIHAHLNLQPPRSPIASEGEESLDIESFEERVARFDEVSVQQWYGDMSFSGFSFDYGGMAGASSFHPPPFESPPPAQTHDDDEQEEEGEEDDDDDE
jgi:hypothetical protein